MKFDKTRIFTAVNADEVKVGSKGYFADTLAGLKEHVTNEEEDFFSIVSFIGAANNVYRFHTESFSGDFALFYLVEEPESEPSPEEVTAAEWDNKPRLMKVWDDDYSKAERGKVIYIRNDPVLTFPVIALLPEGDFIEGSVTSYKHCAEIDATKEVGKEKTYHPYNNADELIADYKRRFCPDCKGIPAIWVKNRVGTLRELVSIDDDGVRLTGTHILFVTYSDFFNTYTYLDGSPCGIEG